MAIKHYYKDRKNSFDKTVASKEISDQDLKDDLWQSIQKCVCSPSRIAECVDLEATNYVDQQKNRNNDKARIYEEQLRAKYDQESELDTDLFDVHMAQTQVSGDTGTTTTMTDQFTTN